MSIGNRTGNLNRRTDAPISRQGGIYKTDNGQQTYTDGQGNKFWYVDTTSGAVSITLPRADEAGADTIYTVIRTTAGANALTVSAASGNINGAASVSMSTQYAANRFISDGSNYYII